MNLPPPIATSVLQQHINAVLANGASIAAQKQVDGTADDTSDEDPDTSDDNLDNDDDDDENKVIEHFEREEEKREEKAMKTYKIRFQIAKIFQSLFNAIL